MCSCGSDWLGPLGADMEWAVPVHAAFLSVYIMNCLAMHFLSVCSSACGVSGWGGMGTFWAVYAAQSPSSGLTTDRFWPRGPCQPIYINHTLDVTVTRQRRQTAAHPEMEMGPPTRRAAGLPRWQMWPGLAVTTSCRSLLLHPLRIHRAWRGTTLPASEMHPCRPVSVQAAK